MILGVPLLQALLGPAYANLGVVAGVSSFIFQLPLMLILFEVRGFLGDNAGIRLHMHKRDGCWWCAGRAGLQASPDGQVLPGSAPRHPVLPLRWLCCLLIPLPSLSQVHAWREENLRGRLPQVLPSSTPSAQSGDGGKAEAGTGPDARSLGRAPSASSQRAHPQSAEAVAKVCAAQRADGAASMPAADATAMPARWRTRGFSLGRLDGQLLGCLNFRMTRKQVCARARRCGAGWVGWGWGWGWGGQNQQQAKHQAPAQTGRHH